MEILWNFKEYTNLSIHLNHVMSNKSFLRVEERAIKGQNSGFIFYFIPFVRKQTLQCFCYAGTVGMVFNDLDKKALKNLIGSVCHRTTPTEYTGPTSSRFTFKHLVSDPLAVNMTSNVSIYQSFFSVVQFKVD